MWQQALLVVFIGIQIIAYQSGFGLPVFLILSIISLIIFGTRNKVEGEVSAYSVFNPSGARLAGQFTAEQFDAQLRGIAPPSSDMTPPAAPIDRGNRLGGDAGAQKLSSTAEERRRIFALAAERRLEHLASSPTTRRC